MKTGFGLVATVATLVLGAGGASAGANLLTNGSFETGNFSGWTQGGNEGFTSVISCCDAGVTGAEDGTYYASLGPVGSDGTLSQTVSDTNGEHLDLSFWFASDGATPNDFTATWDGATLTSVSDAAATNGWENFTFHVIGSGSDTLQFSFRNDPGYQGLDNVSVALPEPAFWALMLVGFGGLGVALRRRARPAAV
jgi:hypothetical protein